MSTTKEPLSAENRALLERVFPDELFGAAHDWRLTSADLNLVLAAARAEGVTAPKVDESEREAVEQALSLARDFAAEEVDSRSFAGGSMSDYINEAQEVVDACEAALAALASSQRAERAEEGLRSGGGEGK